MQIEIEAKINNNNKNVSYCIKNTKQPESARVLAEQQAIERDERREANVECNEKNEIE